MAFQEHVDIARQGADAIAAWRLEHPTLRFNFLGADLARTDLARANLREANLTSANLRLANLRAANLHGANLHRANLHGANLTGANLTGANLDGASLDGAILHRANLTGANLSAADLSGADLSSADLSIAIVSDGSLSGANLANARLWKTTLDADLSEAHGLALVTHVGPSTTTVRMLQQSKNLPDVFLRGVGLPDEMIALYHSWQGVIQFYSCFISYSHHDQVFADRLYADLQAKGVRCWLATKDLKIGDRFRQRIDEAIRIHDKLIVVLSVTSVASEWVEDEVESALEKERASPGQDVLFPVDLDRSVFETDAAWAAKIRRQRHIGDFTGWKDADAYRVAFDRLLRDLRAGVRDPE